LHSPFFSSFPQFFQLIQPRKILHAGKREEWNRRFLKSKPRARLNWNFQFAGESQQQSRCPFDTHLARKCFENPKIVHVCEFIAYAPVWLAPFVNKFFASFFVQKLFMNFIVSLARTAF